MATASSSPRVTVALTGARKSLFARIYSGSAGLDPYTTAVSDTYQDLFGIGSFTGKGIYDVDAFDAAAGHTFPDSQILSHDLIEGNYARCGLVTDIELLDSFPGQYSAYALREHRWARGDWQILPWLFPSVPAPEGTTRRNTLPAVERWKIFDNLRRSLLPPALVILLVLGWTVLPGPFWFWTGLALVVIAWSLVLQLVTGGLHFLYVLFRHRRRARLLGRPRTDRRPGSPQRRFPGRSIPSDAGRRGPHAHSAVHHAPPLTGMGDGRRDGATAG